MADDAAQPDLASIGSAVDWPDDVAATEARERMAAAEGRYGRLDDLAEWLAGTLGAAHPNDLTRPRIVRFATSGEPGSGLAELLDVGRRDVHLDEAGDVAEAGEVTAVEVGTAVGRGVEVADEEVDSGADLVIVVVAGPELPALSLISVLTDAEPVKVLSRGAEATDPQAWIQRAVAVRDARRRGHPHRADPAALVTATGGTELAAAAGCVLQLAARRTPVLLDGLGAGAAALLAYEAQPRAVRWWRVPDSVPGPAHELVLTRLGLRPILDLGLRLRDGTAGALAVPVLRAAIRALGEPSEPAGG